MSNAVLDPLFSSLGDLTGQSLQQPTCHSSELEELEDELSLTLPPWYKSLLLGYDFNDLEIAFYHFLSPEEAIDEHDEAYPGVDLLPRGFFVFASCNGDAYCLNLFDHNDQNIYYCPHDELELEHRFSSFPEFVEHLLEEHHTGREEF